jgi:hypothetical protein
MPAAARAIIQFARGATSPLPSGLPLWLRRIEIGHHAASFGTQPVWRAVTGVSTS